MSASLPPIDGRPPVSNGLPALASRPARAEGLPRLAPEAERTTGPLPPLRPPSPPAASAPPPPRRSRRPFVIAGLVALGLLVAGAAGLVSARIFGDDGQRASAPPSSSTTATAVPQLRDAVRIAEPAVVQITSGVNGATRQGSGVVVGASGVIVTNNHVIEGAESVQVETADGRQIAGRVVKANPSQDLAAVCPVGDPGPGATVASDAGLTPGDTVFAVGSPFGLQNTVTAGIVSSVGRPGRTNQQPYIQFDAPVNPGNSGGGLFDLRGRLVGIPTAIESPNRGNVGIGFAVPVSRVAGFLPTSC